MALASSSGTSDSKLSKFDQKEKNISNNEMKSPEQSVPGSGVVGGGISDSPIGNCHQCRQRTKYFAAACKNQKQNKPCPIKFCHKCLLNRYGEKAEQVSVLEDWKCPKCRGICNCSICMKKRGQRPTGMLVHTAKATGFSSVSEMLQIKGHETIGHEKNVKDMGVSPKKLATPNKEPAGDMSRKRGKENSFDVNLALNPDEKKAKKMKRGGLTKLHGGNSDRGVLDSSTIVDDGDQPKKVLKSSKTKRVAEKFQTLDVVADIRLPQGTELTTVAGIGLLPQDVGHALQFLEFCAAFGEILQLHKGQPESILRDIIRGRSGRGGKYSSTGQFHVQLLSLIQKDLGKEPPTLNPTNGKNSWLRVLKNRISVSQSASNEFTFDRFDTGADAYDRLDSSIKLRLLNFLCDEVLNTDEIRIWIEDQNSKIDEKLKEAKERFLAAKNKEKGFRQKLQDKMAEAIIAKSGAVLTISEQEAIFSLFKTEAAQAHVEMMESNGMVSKMEEERCDAVRTEPTLLGIDGCVFWRLKGYSDKSDILLQDMGTWNAVAKGERWFTFDDEQQKVIEKRINSSRDRKLKSQNVAVPSETRETKP